jgi:CRISPR-associated protein Cst1
VDVMQPAGLRWTGHPLIDMGVAGLTVFAGKQQPEEVIGSDIQEFVEWGQQAYFTKEVGGWISVAFTSNFINPSFGDDKKREVVKAILESHLDQTSLEDAQCAYFGIPAQRIVARDLVPMFTGRDPTNFGADGQPGLALSGLAITALQALSCATPLVGGRLMVIAADDPRLLLALVKAWQPEIRKRAQISQISGEKCGGWSNPRSRLVEQLIEIERSQEGQVRSSAEYQGSATIYHASNSGQGPDITLYSLELPALSFIRKAQGIKYKEAWQRLVSSKWNEAGKDKDPQYGRRNDVYEAVFDLPQGSHGFIRRFFLASVSKLLQRAPVNEAPKRGKKAKAAAEAAEPTVATPQPAPVALWALLQLFLQEVLGMDHARIEAIRTLADRLAGAVGQENDRRLFQRIYTSRKAFEVRQLLIQLGMKRLKNGDEPAVRFAEYLHIFEEGEELARADFGLAWDLTRMRVIERLFEQKWFDGNQEALSEIKEEDEEDSNRI